MHAPCSPERAPLAYKHVISIKMDTSDRDRASMSQTMRTHIKISPVSIQKKEATSGCFLFVLFLSALNIALRQKFKIFPVYHYVATALRNNFTNFILSQKVRLRNVTTCNFVIGCHANRTTQCPSRQAPCNRQCRRAVKPCYRRLQQLRRQPRVCARCACDRAQAHRRCR